MKCFSSEIQDPSNVAPSNLSFVRIYAQSISAGFYGILITFSVDEYVEVLLDKL